MELKIGDAHARLRTVAQWRYTSLSLSRQGTANSQFCPTEERQERLVELRGVLLKKSLWEEKSCLFIFIICLEISIQISLHQIWTGFWIPLDNMTWRQAFFFGIFEPTTGNQVSASAIFTFRDLQRSTGTG